VIRPSTLRKIAIVLTCITVAGCSKLDCARRSFENTTHGVENAQALGTLWAIAKVSCGVVEEPQQQALTPDQLQKMIQNAIEQEKAKSAAEAKPNPAPAK
jgi:hypothetical protein